MKNKTECVSGTQLKLNINVSPLDELHMADYEFECNFFVFKKRSITIKKEEMIRVDDDNYLALVDTNELGIGNLHITFIANVPDHDFGGALRKEIVCVPTDINIINC